MENALLIQTLSAFSPAERQDIKRFLADSYFNRGKHANQILRLFNLLDDKIHQKKMAGLSKALLFAEFFPDKKITIGYFENLMSELLALLRRFIWLQEADKEVAHDLATARFYRKHGLTERAEQLLNRMSTRSPHRPRMLPAQLLQRFEGALELSEIQSGHNHRRGDLNLPATIEALTVFYSSQLLQLAGALYQQERLVPELNTGWNIFIDPLRALLQERQHFGDPALALFEQAVRLAQCTSDDPEKQVALFLESMQTQEPDLLEWTLKNLATYARNFCGYHIQRDKPNLIGPLLTLYQEHLEKGWLYENGLLPASVLLNMIIIGLRANQQEWVLKVLQSHRGKVANDENQILWQYCWAKYHFRMGDFDEAERFIVLQTQKDIEIEKSMRILSIQIAYERSYIHLDANLDAYGMFLNRNKRHLSSEKMQHNTHFISVVRRMNTLRHLQSTQSKTLAQVKRIQELTLQLSTPAYKVAERQWLLEKTAQL